ncbi:MAG: ATP-binding protein [Chloroflexi bacterium]|nr:ATP-binding protein [Chloroflexota bacterium]
MVVFDEFGYLATAEKALPSIIQAIWDRDAQASQIKLVLCGSEISTLGSLDDYGKPLHGRFNWIETYASLDYYDAGRFLAAAAPEGGYSHREKLMAYGIYGGSGRYLAAVDPMRPLGENVARQILDPSGVFHREGETLIRQERDIRDASGYNAVLAAIANGATDWGAIVNQAHIEKASLQGYLNRLQRVGWVRHETPFGEPNRRGTYRLADNMLKSWYRYVFRYRSALQMMPPERAWREIVAPDLPDYMGFFILEEVAYQYLARFASRHGLPMILEIGRWWSRKGDVEIDVVARLSDGSYLYGECKWASSPMTGTDLGRLQSKVEAIPHQGWKRHVRYALFSAGEFDGWLRAVARREQVLLVDGAQLFAP